MSVLSGFNNDSMTPPLSYINVRKTIRTMPANSTFTAAVNPNGNSWTYNSYFNYTPTGQWGVQQEMDTG